MPTRYGWLQSYNGQFAITADQLVLATEVTTNPSDLVSYQTMTSAAQHAAEVILADPEGITTPLYDAGYASDDTLAAAGDNTLIALGKARSVREAARERPTTGPPPPGATPRQAMDHRLRTPEGAALYTRRGATVEPGIGNFKNSSPASPAAAWPPSPAKSSSPPPCSTSSNSTEPPPHNPGPGPGEAPPSHR